MFGPDGKPITVTGPIIGGPKGLVDLDLFPDEIIDQMFSTFDALVARGQPLEIPAAMATGQLAQTAKTMKFYKDRTRELEAELASLKAGDDNGADTPDLQQLDLRQLDLMQLGGVSNLGRSTVVLPGDAE
jgi:hypothetical protein